MPSIVDDCGYIEKLFDDDHVQLEREFKSKLDARFPENIKPEL